VTVTEYGRDRDRAGSGAVAFDCDGTLADTERLTRIVFERVLARYGYAFTVDDFGMIVGRSLQQNHADLGRRVTLPPFEAFEEEWYALSYELLDEDLVLFDDAVGALRELIAAGVPVAVVSSSPREHVRRVLVAAELVELVPVVVASEDVVRHKPDPAPYLLAARLLGVDPGACVAVEDTPTGLAAASAAGMATMAVRRADHEVGDLSGADVVVDEVHAAELQRMLVLAAMVRGVPGLREHDRSRTG
jgi:HAD superfamily hydrolase (TIGR01509 family)